MNFKHQGEWQALVFFSLANWGCSDSSPIEKDEITTGAGGTEAGSGGSSSHSGGTPGGVGGQSTGSGGEMTAIGGSQPSSGGAATGAGGSTDASGGPSETGGAGGSVAEGSRGSAEASGGMNSIVSEPMDSPGCGTTNPSPCDTEDSPCTIESSGMDRAYYVVLPDNYDASKAYPVVFQFHPLGGSAEQGMNMYRIRSNFPDAIYVTPQGLQEGTYTGWSNTDGQDEVLTRDIIAEIEANYCIDRSRYFSTGFSFGGSMSYTAAMCMSDIFRGVGIMAGAPISGANDCTPERPVAAWINHGVEDEALPITMSRPLRDILVELNGCSEETEPVDPEPCVSYKGCDEGFPVIWCEVEGMGHAIPDHSPTTIAEFFQLF